jgi:hypothetical protein
MSFEVMLSSMSNVKPNCCCNGFVSRCEVSSDDKIDQIEACIGSNDFLLSIQEVKVRALSMHAR